MSIDYSAIDAALNDLSLDVQKAVDGYADTTQLKADLAAAEAKNVALLGALQTLSSRLNAILPVQVSQESVAAVEAAVA